VGKLTRIEARGRPGFLRAFALIVPVGFAKHRQIQQSVVTPIAQNAADPGNSQSILPDQSLLPGTFLWPIILAATGQCQL